jgi:hypothetical protein
VTHFAPTEIGEMSRSAGYIIVTVESHNVNDPVSFWVISIKSMEGPTARAEIDVR